MKAIILAAGMGIRANHLFGNKPKCLFEVGGELAIERQLRLLNAEGIKEIILVVGYEADQIKTVVGKRAKFIYNPDYDQTSSLYSLWKANKKLNDNVLILNSDIVYTRKFLKPIRGQFPICLAVNTQRPYEEIDVGAQIVNGRIVKVVKNLPKKFCDAEKLDGFFVSKRGCQRLKKMIKKIIDIDRQKGGICTLENELAKQEPLDFSDVGYNCVEFDTMEEYKRARKLFG